MAWGSFQVFVKIVVLLFVCTAFVSCSEEDRFGIGLERPEDAGLTEFQKKTLQKLRAESVEEMKDRLKNAIFYRVTANYTHKDRKTGEIEEISFDVVAMCGGRVLMDEKGYTVSETDGVNPAHFFRQTKDDGFIMLRVPFACKSNHFAKEIPTDFTPFVAWFANVHKPMPGLGYISEDAYESPISQLQFKGADIKLVDFGAWLEWRKKRLKTFTPVGFIKSPWGVSLAGNEPENLQSHFDSHSNFGGFRFCRGQRRVALPKVLKDHLRNYWPDQIPEFWWEKDIGVKPYSLNEIFKTNKEYEGGELWAGDMVPYRYGILTKSGGGYLYANFDYKRADNEIYPKYRIARVESTEEKLIVNNLASRIDFRPEMKGFLSCGTLFYKGEVDVKSHGYDQGEGVYVGKVLLLDNQAYFNYKYSGYFMEYNNHLWRPQF